MTPGGLKREGGQVPHSNRPGDVLADRYTLVDLLSESRGGLFWRAHDRVLSRHVALHVIPVDDERAPHLMEAAKRSAAVVDSRILRVLDADERDGQCYVVNEWGNGKSLDNMLDQGPLSPRRAAWIVSEVAASLAKAHDAGVTHGRLVPENVMIDHNGSVKIIGFAVDAALSGLPPGRRSTDVVDLAGVLYAALVGKWPGISRSRLPAAPMENGHPLRPRKVRAGIPKPLDIICEQVLSPFTASSSHARLIESAAEIRDALVAFVGDPGALATEGDTGPMPAVPQVTTQPEPAPPVADPDATQTMVPPADPEWRAQRDDAPPPPPDFDQPAPKPLFAEDSVRRPRPMSDSMSGSQEFWPWEKGGEPSPNTGTTERVLEEEPVPGRSWLRLAGIIAAAVLLLVAVTFAFNLGRDRSGEDLPDAPGASETDAGTVVITPVAADDFDPQGDPPEEYPELVDNVLDGDRSTSWHTSTYDQQFGPGGLKDGVGIVLDLGSSQTVGSVDVGLVGAPTGLQLFILDRKPTGTDGLTPAAETTASGTEATLTPETPTEGRYLLVWLNSLPHPSGFRGGISDVVVHS
jgi:serine/threonine protein kinase